MDKKMDHIDRSLIRELQKDERLSQRDLADRVGLSQNACWRRLKQLEERGVIKGQRVLIDRRALGKTLVVFTLLRTRSHSKEWLTKFRRHVTAIPDIVDFYRIGGDYDYMIKIVTEDMESFDQVYQRLIDTIELDAVTSYFAMEGIIEDRPIPV
ncbi:Lrp/AsnC family transcriptional regulator [Rhodobacteraceae bacterium N5(2021)]|uniref:Lrp/AsnC family transcriptional regulator n=1 Tax=Gymnodinialimonas phycosphaerae TaxID=2841589 RepID=A0A975TWY0_9RHOB|nr:Lrp/AsnC family transcriptional regulator [Gymnodinialimonas phycosphaerae]MBY4891944.1 Lrp/AsnC family transcriptional regulator [Gymnodinialimonas phycosphaerae]